MRVSIDIAGHAFRKAVRVCHEVRVAIEHFDQRRLQPFKKDLEGSMFGKAVLSGASALLQISAKHQAGHDKLQRAFDALVDPRLPRVEGASPMAQGGAPCEISNFSLVIDGSMVEILDGSMGDISDCVQLMEKSQLHDQVGFIKKWRDQVIATLRFLDECASVFLFGTLQHAGLANVLQRVLRPEDDSTSGDAGASPGGGTAARQWKVLLGAAAERMYNEEALLKSLIGLHDLLAGILPDHLSNEVYTADVEATVKELEAGFNVRAGIMRVLHVMAEFSDFHTDAQQALDEWSTARSQGKEVTSCLAVALRLETAVRSLRDASIRLGDRAKGASPDKVLTMSDAFRLFRVTGNLRDALHLHASILNAPTLVSSCQLLRSCLQGALDSFGRVVNVDAIALPPCILDAHQGEALARMLDGFHTLGAEDSAEVAQATSRVFQGKRGCESWHSRDLLDLAFELMGCIPPSDFHVDMACFCEGHGGRVMHNVHHVRKEMDRICTMSQVSQTLVFLRARGICSDPVARDGTFKSELERAIDFAFATSTKMLAELSACKDEWLEDEGAAPWLLVLRQMKQWFSLAVKAIRKVARYVVGKMVVAAASGAEALQRVTPPFAHIAGDGFWNPKLAKQHLLRWPSRVELNAHISQMFMQLAACQRLHTQWGMVPALTEDEDFRADILGAQSAFDAAKLAVAVIACANILLEMKGSARTEKADDMLTRAARMQLPRALVTELHKASSRQ